MEILISIAGKIAENTVAPIGNQVGYLLFYKDNFREVKNRVEELKAIKKRIENDVATERRNGRETEADVENWLNKVTNTLEEVERLCEDSRHANIGCSRWCFPNLKLRHQLSRNAKKMAKNVTKVQGEGKFNRVGYLPPLHIVDFISTTRGSEKLGSRNLMKEDIISTLRDFKVSKIGIYGLGGVGKTTLVKEVAKQVKDDKLFDALVMTTLSQTLDIERIQGEIADQLGFHFEDMTVVGKATRLHERIKKEKTILIILDDIWKKIDLGKLGIPLEDDYKGCKLLLTSRNHDILQEIGTQKNFKLEVLDDVETWNLFHVMAGEKVKDVNLQNIATQVAKRCSGLPILIVTMAKSLKDKNIHYWKDALNQLERIDGGDMHEIVDSALKFSYNQLENDEVKKVFLLCGVHDTSIWISDLLKYVIGLGIFKYINTIEDARNRLYTIIGNLKASCMLLDDDASAGTIEMHDIICKVAISIASRDQYVFTIKRNARLKDWPSEDFFERCTQITLRHCGIQKLPKNLNCPNLKFLLLDSNDNRTLKIPNSFFEGMVNLEVLDLTGMIISSLPTSLTSLTKLKTLCLDQCSLKDMAGIGTLKNLEILSFIHSSMEEFPSEIGQLSHLRMLDLTKFGFEVIPPHILSKLTKLEELYMGNTSIKWAVESLAKQNKSASLVELTHLTNLTTLEIQICEPWILPRYIKFEKLERYKIVIGDKWEWLDVNKGNSRLLKLKLDTSIHLEREIKTLIKRVEDLYLDEIHGISNVLFQLNGEGFPLLKHLHIQNNGEIQHIINSIERNQTHVLFPKLKTLILYNLNNLEKICHGPLIVNSFAKLIVIKVKSCDQLVYLFSILMVKALSQLREIEVSECRSMKKIVFIESVDGGITIDDKIEFYSLRSLTLRHLPAIDDFCSNELTSSIKTKQNSLKTNVPTSFFNAKVKFSNLETLKLSSVNLEKVWDDDQPSAAYSLPNLAYLIVEDCSGLKYLFSSSMIERFLNLKQLEISKCDMMEEIIATKWRNGTALEEVRLSKLETIVVNNMKSLKKVWHRQFDGLKTLEVKNCEKLENILPSYMHEAFGRLETLTVSDCNSVQEIFQLGVNHMPNAEDTTQLKNITLLRLPHLKQIWSRDPQTILRFHNLQVVRVEHCEDLEYLFPFSIAMDALQLEEITIKGAGKMKEIVSKNEGSVDSPVKFEFNHITSLVLWNLSELKGFFAGNHSLSCTSLRELDVRYCAKLKLFKTLGTSSQGRVSDSKLPVSTQQPLFTLEEVICNLEKLALNVEDANMILQGQFPGEQFCRLKFLFLIEFEDDQATLPYWFLQNITSLEWLLVECSSFKEIFQDEGPLDEKGQIEIRTRIKKLTLHQLPELQHICKEGFQLDPVLEVLEYLHVFHCSNLKQLVPSSVAFSHLTYLKVQNCNGLIDLITSSTARSLVKLTTLKIRGCNSVEQIVAEEGEESRDEIAFSSLEVLELECLPKIKRFCSNNCFLQLPLLEKVVVKQCPRMKSFSMRDTSAPMLRKILTDEQDEKWCWEGDLNRTVNKMFQDMVAFSSFNHLELSEYPELKELWYGQVGQKIFRNLKYLVVHKCVFLSNIIFSSNLLQSLYTLEELEVTECDSLEAVFDVTVGEDNVTHPKDVSRLKKLTLSRLPNLKHIWNRDPREMLSFRNLQVVKVATCQNLKNLFSISLCQDLQQLEELNIESCGIEEIVATGEGLEKVNFDFSQLTILRLILLTQLNSFYPGRHTLECPSLKILNVSSCKALQIFAFGHLDFQALGVGDVDMPIQQALFCVEKVSQNLEELSLSEKDATRILNGRFEKNLFRGIKILRLQHFQETPIMFLNDLLERFPTTTTFQVRWSSFETLFLSEEIGYCSIKSPSQIKKLWLFELEQLKHIWNDDSVSDPLVQNLEYLSVKDCSGLIRLAPPSISFINLTAMEVEDCNGLIYLMTSFTAKSLVHLTSLTVKNCGMIEDVVINDEGELEEQITFESLEYLELTSLSSFKSFCSGKHTFIFPSLVRLIVTGCHKMQNFSSGVTIAPFLKVVEVEKGKKRWKEDLNTTIKQLFMDKAIREGDEGNYKESSSNISESSQAHQSTASTTGASSSEEHGGQSKPDQIADTGKREMHKLPSLSYDKEQKEHTSSTYPPSIQGAQDLAQAAQNALSPSTVHDTVIGTREMSETIKMPLVQVAQNAMIPTIAQDTAITTQEIYETIEKPLVQTAQNTLSPTTIRDAEIHPNKNLFNQTTTTINANNTKTIGTREIHETSERTIVQATQNASSPTTTQDAEESHDLEARLSENLFNETPTSITVDNRETTWAQEMCEAIERPVVQAAQNARSLTTIQNAEKSHALEILPSENLFNQTTHTRIAENGKAIDLVPSQASDAMSSSILVADAYTSSTEMIDISVQNLPYLMAGVKRHPQVLDWLNKKRRRVFASLFAEVTRLLRTTRRGDLTEDDRNYIRECCTCLEVVGFDASWLSYVYGCIEECGDGENLKRRLEEAEAKASILKKELASVEASLGLLRDKASRLDNFIES